MRNPSCPPELWPTFSRLLDEALEQPEAARAAWLERLPTEHAAVRPWLERVLLHPAGKLTGDWLRAPQLPPSARTGIDSDYAAGDRFGPWELVEPLGQGGMGVVWRARRADGLLQREAALKLPHAHLLAGPLRERFSRERDILAALAHPHIAALYDAGLADSGQPWLALELVRGEHLPTACQSRRLGVDARLALFGQVLAAVQYAHARLVVHRDLKPGNVLVDDQGQVKLLDFGIAKLLDGEAAGEATALTRLGGRAATPDYAAPEQLAGGSITTATDVYALGAMLYELLCGQRPQPGRHAARLSLSPAVATESAEAPLASGRVDADYAAQVDGASVASLRRALRGDLDAILAKALSPTPEQRYATVEAFAADLARAGRHEPIVARRIGRLQLAGKFLRRHRVGAGLGAALALAVAVGIAGVLWQAREAQQQARRAEAVKDFLLGVFKASDPRIAQDKPRGQITARELLDSSAGRIEARFADDPEIQIELLRTAADLYRELGEDADYERLQARQLELVREHYGPLHQNLIDGAVEAAGRACTRQDWTACARLQQAADELLHEAEQDHQLPRAYWQVNEAIRLRAESGTEGARRALLQQALALFRLRAPGAAGEITTLHELAGDAQSAGDYAGAIAHTRVALALAERLPERNDSELQTTWSNLGIVQQQAGDFLGAGESFEKSAAIAARTNGADDLLAQIPRAQAARTLHLAGERERAMALFATLKTRFDSSLESDDLATARENYGERLAAEGRAAEGIPYLERAERRFRQQSAFEFALRRVRRHLGDAYERIGRIEDARRVLQLSLADHLAKAPPGTQPTIAIRERWGRFLLARGELAPAAEQFRLAIEEAQDKHWAHVALAQGGLAAVALRRGDLAEAQARSAQALATWDALVGFRDVRMKPALQRLRADVLAAAGDVAGAQALEDAAAAASARYDAPESATRQRRVMGTR